MATFLSEIVIRNLVSRRENNLDSLNKLFVFCAVRLNLQFDRFCDPADQTPISLNGASNPRFGEPDVQLSWRAWLFEVKDPRLGYIFNRADLSK
jgi:hypothetical protein